MSAKATSKDSVRTVITLFCDGWGERSIHRITGLSESTVRRILRGQHPHNRRRLMNGQRDKKTLRVYQ